MQDILPNFGEVSPRPAKYTEQVLFGEIWKRPGLSPRDRSLVTCATVIAANRASDLQFYAGGALDNGLTPRELSELVTHLSFYLGWTICGAAAGELVALYAERRIEPHSTVGAPMLELDPESEDRRRSSVEDFVAPVSRILADHTNDVLFGDVWRNPDLAPRDRSLATVVALIAIGQAEQMPFHLNRAMDNGLSESEISEVLAHLAYYAGWPRVMSACSVAGKVLKERRSPPR
jgi:4-carboxymuconolactone decarboxylase